MTMSASDNDKAVRGALGHLNQGDCDQPLLGPHRPHPPGAVHPLDFYRELVWIDGRPLLDVIEPYRQRILTEVLWTFGDDGAPVYSMAVNGRAKKNWKTGDLTLAGLYKFLAWPSPAGNDSFILANDEGQAADDLALVKKLFAANPTLDRRVSIYSKEIARKDGRGVMRILPARDIAGAHGKTYLFAGFDEIHAYRSHDLFEALAADPTRRDVLVWITSYAGIRHAPGIPLFDFMAAGKRGDDPKLYFSWYAGDFTTDLDFADATPEQRANPSMASWGNDAYLDTQRRRLPVHKFRRLHLNLPGAPDGAALDGDKIMAAIIRGRRRLAYEAGVTYFGFVDMSGGSNDDATLAIAHRDAATKRLVLDLLVCQVGAPPFNPRDAVRKFVGELKTFGLSSVTGDSYAGQTFRRDFEDAAVSYIVSSKSASQLYDAFEPHLNAGEIELLDHPKMIEPLLTLVLRSGRIDHLAGDHDDHALAAAAAIVGAAGDAEPAIIAYYAGLAKEAEAMANAPSEDVFAPLDPADMIAVRVTSGSSTIFGATGRRYVVDANATIMATAADAAIFKNIRGFAMLDAAEAFA
jgi:phage terminase large subunit-like protein